MVEREQGTRHRDAEPVAEDHGVTSMSIARPDPSSAEEVEAVRHAEFLAALDVVMKDHHNVLAALAK